MKRRSFLQSVIGFLDLPFVPKSKAKWRQPPFCGTCNKFKLVKVSHVWNDPHTGDVCSCTGLEGRCFDNPLDPQSALKNNTACKWHNQPPQPTEVAKDLRFESDIYAPNNPNSKIKWRRYEVLKPSIEPLFEDLDPTPEPIWPEWKQIQAVHNHVKWYSNQIFGYSEEIK